jgi:predicted NBD/HSP70 family sugar kinase
MVINTKISGTPSSLRKVHRMMALQSLLFEKQCSRKLLAKKLGISTMAASRISNDLINAGLISENGFIRNEHIPGPNQIILEINKNSVFGIGVVLSAYNTEIGIVGADGEIVVSKKVSVKDISDGKNTLLLLVNEVKKIIKIINLPFERILGVGVTVAADLNPSKTKIAGAGYLGWKPFDIKKTIEKEMGIPAFVDKIANALVLAEKSIGCAKNLNNILLIHSSTVLGASIIINNEVVEGAQSKSGRIGHLSSKKTELICSCARDDCLNCVASGWSVLVEAGLVKNKKYNPDLVPVYAKLLNRLIKNKGSFMSSNKVANLLTEAGRILANSITKINQILDPEIIILAGLLTHSNYYLSGIKLSLKDLGQDGVSALSKLKIGNVKIVEATSFMPLLKNLYSPNFNFEELYQTAHLVEKIKTSSRMTA